MQASATGVTISNIRGLHATPACMLSQLSMKFKSKIRLEHGNGIVNAKALIKVVSLGIKTGELVNLYAEGEDATEAITALVDLIEVRNFDGE